MLRDKLPALSDLCASRSERPSSARPLATSSAALLRQLRSLQLAAVCALSWPRQYGTSRQANKTLCLPLYKGCIRVHEAMRPFRIIPRQNPARRLSRVHAFEAQGVTLRYRREAGAACALRMGWCSRPPRVRRPGHDEGFRCLLWAPLIEGVTEWVDRPKQTGKLEHCRLAALHGAPMVCSSAAMRRLVEPDAILALRVEKRQEDIGPRGGSLHGLRRPGCPRSAIRPLLRSPHRRLIRFLTAH